MVIRLALAITLLAGCALPRLVGLRSRARPTTPTQVVAPAGMDVSLLSLATARTPARDFAVCTPGLVLVPVDGGVALAGWDGWLVPPGDGRDIHSVDCDEAGDIFFVDGGALVRQSESGGQATRARVALPPGDYHVVSTVNVAAWVWGRTSRGVSVVLRWDPADGLVQVGSIDDPIRAAAVAGVEGLLTAVGRRLVLWRHQGGPQVVATLDETPRGLAVEPDGSVLLAMADGIVRLRAGGSLEPYAAGASGPLVLRGRTLFVLVPEGVLRLSPATP